MDVAFRQNWFNGFFTALPQEQHSVFVQVILEFLNPSEPLIRRYILRLLTSYFFMTAKALNASMFEDIEKRLQAFHLNLVFDSAVLVSAITNKLLSDEDQRAGHTITRALAGIGNDANMFVSPMTLNEVGGDLRSIAALESGSQPRLISKESERRQLEIRVWRHQARPSDNREWLFRTLGNLEMLARNSGIFREDYPTERDLTDRLDFWADLDDVIPAGPELASRKGPEEWMHDVLLWHFVDTHRSPRYEIKFESEWWLLTDDPELIAFDRERSERSGYVPICIHPFALLQLLRFVQPSDEAYESAFLSALRTPLLASMLEEESDQSLPRLLDALDWWEALGPESETSTWGWLLERELRRRLALVGPAHAEVEAARNVLRTHSESVERGVRRVRDKMSRIKKDSHPDELIATVTRVLDEYQRDIADARRQDAHAKDQIQPSGERQTTTQVDGGVSKPDARVVILHISDTQFGKNHLFGNNGLTEADRNRDTLFARLHKDLKQLGEDHGVRPDLLVVSGDLAEWALPSEFAQVVDFLEQLTAALGLPSRHVAVVPGNHDVNRSACEAYFLRCKADEVEPRPPYWPKWEQFESAMRRFYANAEDFQFTPDRPWSLFEMSDLRLVVAGLNSTMAESHRHKDHYGWLGEEQLSEVAERLRAYEARGWLRIGVVHHNVQRAAQLDDENLRDSTDLERILAPRLNLVLNGHTHDAKMGRFSNGIPILSTGSAAVVPEARPGEVPNQYQLIEIRRDRVTRWARCYSGQQKQWIGDTRVSARGNDWKETFTAELVSAEATFP